MANGLEVSGSSGEWRDDRRLVLHELKRLGDELHEHRKESNSQNAVFYSKFNDVHADLIMLKTKASLWGGVSGVVLGALAGMLVNVFLES